MSGTRPGALRRRILHPLAPSLALVVLAGAGAVGALRGVPGCGALLAVTAGAAAGLANPRLQHEAPRFSWIEIGGRLVLQSLEGGDELIAELNKTDQE